MSMNTMTKSRIPWIDIAKGYGTILVIYAHLGVGPLWSWIYSFHMPLFFFLSGYVFSTKYNFIEFAKRKCKSLLLPYFCLGIPMIAYEVLQSIRGGYYTSDWACNLVKLFLQQKRLWTLWFMAALFCLNLLFYVIVRICKREWLISLISIVLPLLGLWYYKNGGQAVYWNVDACLMAIPFFCAGYLYKEHGHKVELWLQGRWQWLCTFLVCGVTNVICWRKSLDETGVGLEMFDCKYGNPGYTYLAAFAGVACVVLISKAVIVPPVRYLGENSLLYYAWHQIIMIPIVSCIVRRLGVIPGAPDSAETFAYKIVCLVMIIAILTVVNWIMKKLRLQWMLGKFYTKE